MNEPRKKKPYETPDFRSESVVESSTLACGKCTVGGPVGSATPSCKSVRKLS